MGECEFCLILNKLKGNPVLRIGNHLCEGKVIKLRKPIASESRSVC